MDVPGKGRKDEAPWKKMLQEELEKQYSPSQWVVRLGAEGALKTYSEMGKEAGQAVPQVQQTHFMDEDHL